MAEEHEVVVTPEMIEAGLNEFYSTTIDAWEAEYRDMVARVFRVMLVVRDRAAAATHQQPCRE